MTLRIDSHQHYWRLARGDYGWLQAGEAALAPLVSDFLPDDLSLLLAAHGVLQTVLVQAAPSLAETRFLLDLADQHASIAGVVGWVDLSHADAVAELERFAAHPRFKAVRPVLQDIPDIEWIATAPDPGAVQALIRLGLRFDALVQPWHLAPLLRFVDRWPALPVVIDHAAKPQLASGWDAAWAAQWRIGMAELAKRPNVHCKFSGLVTECPVNARADAVATLRPVWDALLRWFGPQRLMWGSDWPVLTLAASYGDWVRCCEAFASALAPEQQAAFWSGNAARFYGLAGGA